MRSSLPLSVTAETGISLQACFRLREAAAGRRRCYALGICILLSMTGPAAFALERIELTLGRLQGPGWQAEGVVAAVTLGEQPGVTIRLDSLAVPAPLDVVHGLGLDCPEVLIEPGQVGCPDATLSLNTTLLERPQVRASFSLDSHKQWQWSIRDAAFAKGRVALRGAYGDERWWLTLDGRNIDLTAASARLTGLVPMPKGFAVSGRGNLSLQMSGAPTPGSLALETELSSFAFADEPGLREGADLDLSCTLRTEQNRDDWTFAGQCDAGRGLVYVDPLYIEVGSAPLHLSARGQWNASARRLALERLAYRHPSVLEFHGRAVAAGEDALAVEELRVDLTEASLDGFYPVYVQPLIGDGLLELETEGRLAGRLQWRRQGAARIELHLQDVDVDDAAGRAGLHGLTGELRWGQGLPAEVSRLRWSGGHIYRAQLGAVELEAAAQGRQVSLLRPASLPVFDGVLHIDELELDDLGTPQSRWRFQGLLSPMSMEAVSQALGWPPLGGTLAGVVPAVTYADGRITVEGALLVRAFDGEIVIHDLSLERPFGLVPELAAEADIRDLSLEQLTGAFSFGNIQGRLDGAIRNLRLEDWKPATFDARFYTPPGDASRHRISQRAVDNLASLGGAGGALSRTFMRFFKEFSYSRLGIACRLREGVCEMDGVAPAEHGYYIVKGGGIPRIDVVGYNRRVDWDTLVHRLKSVTDTAEPAVR